MAKSLSTFPNKGAALMSLTGYQATIGLISLLKRRRDDAREAFSLAAGYLLDLIGVAPATAPCGARKSAMEFALLSGNGEFESRCLKLGFPAACQDLGRTAEPYARALHALASKDFEAARGFAAQLSQVTVEEAQKAKYYPHLGEVISCIVEKNDSALRKALENLLERHGHYSKRGHLRGSESTLLCTPAAALSVLATRLGLHPTVDDQLRRIPQSFRVSALEIWEGGPTRGLTFETVADVLPLDLLA